MPIKKNGASQTADSTELLDIAKILEATLDLDTLLRRIGAMAEKLINAEASAIMLLDDEKKNLTFKTASGEKGAVVKRMNVPLGTGFAGWVAKHWKPLRVNEAARDERYNETFDKASLFQTKSVICVPMLLNGDLIGVVEVLNKKSGDFTEQDLSILSNLSALAAVAITNAKLTEEQRNFFSHAMEILVTAAETRFPETKGHSDRVAQAACAMAKGLGLKGEEYRDLYYAALLHDIGVIKCANPRDPQHVSAGVELLKDIKMLRGAVPLIRHHHEYWNGTGYPDKLSKEAIPLGSRILCLLEAVEDFRSQNGTAAQFPQTVQRHLSKGSGSEFDPAVVKIFLDQSVLESFL